MVCKTILHPFISVPIVECVGIVLAISVISKTASGI